MNKTQAHIVKRRNRRNANGSFGLGTTTPAYAWDFVNNKARFNNINYGVLSNTPGWSFTRASTGYAQTAAGVLVPFASGELRKTDKGVLIEGARTNLCLQSQTFDNASWTKNQSSVSANATAAPDGTSTADLLTEDSSAGAVHRATQSPTTTAAAHTASIYVKPNGRTWLYVRMTDNTSTPRRCYFNCSGSGSVGTAQSGMTGTITALANGWYRVAATIATALAGANFLVFGLSSADNTETYTGDGTSGIYLWGAQLEAAAHEETTTFPSSYIPTTTASATRAADVLTVPVTQASPLAAFAEFEYATGNSSDALNSRYALQLGTSSANRAIFYNLGNNGANGMLVQVSDNEQAGPTVASSSIASGVVQKVAGSVDTNNFRYAANGVSGTPDVSGTGLSDVTVIKFATDTTNQALYGYLRRAALWTRALTDAELQAVTR